MTIKLSVTMDDAYGRTTQRTYGMEDEALLATLQASAAAFLTALAAVTDLGVVKANFIIPVLPDPTFAETAGANVDVGATASGWIEAGMKKASMKVPGIKDALVSADGSVDITGVVATFLALFESAANFNLSDGEQIDTWIRAALDR